MEYLTFGPALWRCRIRFLPQLEDRGVALIFGDGDGRFTAALLAANPRFRADTVDSSAVMLRLLRERSRAAAPDAFARLRTHHTDALTFVRTLPPAAHYDLIVSHFFLDCLGQTDVQDLVHAVVPHTQPGALWLISDFRVPSGAMRWPARALVRSLYFGFRVLTGLRTTRLPDHSAALRAAGFTCVAQRLALAGVLSSELWMFTPQPPPAYTPHHVAAAATSASGPGPRSAAQSGTGQPIAARARP